MKNDTSRIADSEFEALLLRRLLRRQRGEGEDAAAAARIAAAIAADPARARLAESFERTWQGLELPPAGATSVAPLLLERLRGDELRWSLAPNWARAAAALALVCGLGAGWGLGFGFEPGEKPAALTAGEPARPAATAGSPIVSQAPSAESPDAGSQESAIQVADLSASPPVDGFSGYAEAFGADAGYGDPGFAESFWLAAEDGALDGEVW